ncbi:MAG: leucyl/phenylalanyl-tRNA--protein transferase [Verrucomicrobia bacterium]|nr:leucyl/phenylalanyl-tRNA--protein transferase [Verrucomicrobiota bacterium]
MRPPVLTFPSVDRLARGPEVVAETDASALTVENLRAAYRCGVFPWPGEPSEPIPWCCPRRRAILEFSALTPGRTLEKAARKPGWSYSIDRAFPAVIAACAAVYRPGQFGTWISPAVLAAYTALHHAGWAHSVEVWRDDRLVGGLYGVDAGGFFGGESMFHHEDNASKLAILFLAQYLTARGQTWMDIQQLTPHMQRLGARELTRPTFLTRLAGELATGRTLFAN